MIASQLQREIKKKRPFEQAEAELYLNLRRTHGALHAGFAALFRKHNLTETQYNVLRILSGDETGDEADGLPSLEIAARMVTQASDITRLLDRMQDAGLVERNRTRDDRRVVRVVITAKGRRLLKKLHQPVIALHSAQLGHLSRQDLNQLNRLLERARETVALDGTPLSR